MFNDLTNTVPSYDKQWFLFTYFSDLLWLEWTNLYKPYLHLKFGSTH